MEPFYPLPKIIEKQSNVLSIVFNQDISQPEMNLTSNEQERMDGQLEIEYDGTAGTLCLQAFKDDASDQLRAQRTQLSALFRSLPSYIQSVALFIQSENQVVSARSVLRAYRSATYRFNKYKRTIEQPPRLKIYSPTSVHAELCETIELEHAKDICRDLINEPYSTLNSAALGERIGELSNLYGISCELFNETKIRSLKMGGLLAVNKGSAEPPLFAVLEYQPQNYNNKEPVILVGKGIVYDSGGLSLKPTPNSMDLMKSDMSGAALVIGSMLAVAKNNLPIHLMALIPITDNMPGPESVAPGDVIKMHNGMHIEVMNTDAEGRLILADALSYANKYKPQLVLDFATLTGAAVRAIGDFAMVGMGTAGPNIIQQLKEAARISGERWVEFPLWDEYGQELKSEIADLKNLGGANAGAITAGKFLEYFTDYPWMHFDIAGPAYYQKAKGEYPTGGTGFGLEFTYSFLKSYCLHQ